MEEQKITDIMDRFIKQADINIALAEKSVQSVTNCNKRLFISLIVIVCANSIITAWGAYFYFKTSSYYYPTMSAESQAQSQSVSSKTGLNINKK